MDTVLALRLRFFLLCGVFTALLVVPALAQAEAIPKQTEAVTVKRYLMGRVKPELTARGAAHLWTNTGFSNRRAVYPVLQHKVLQNGSEWLQVKAIRDRSQVNVWIPKWATRRVVIPWLIRIDISQRQATIFRDGRVVRRWRVVVGAPSTPTPTGHFFVVDRMHLHVSWAPNKWAMATSAFSNILKHFEGGIGEIALHDRGFLSNPVGTAASHGCVRFNHSDMDWLAANIPNGTPIWIQK